MKHLPGPLLAAAFASLLGQASIAAQTGSALPPESWDTQRTTVVVDDALGRSHVQGEVLVRLQDGASMESLLAAVSELDPRVIGGVPRLGLVKLAIGARVGAEFAAQELSKRPEVRYAELNYRGEGGGGTPPDDTFYGSQWALENPVTDADLDMEGAWAIEEGDPAIVLAVLDTGISFTHPEFLGRTLPGHDFVNEDTDPTADHPHGIHVAGLAAANTDNGFQIAGVDRGCSILPVKVLDASSGGDLFDLVQALDYCAQQQADVVSMSLINYPLTNALVDALAGARAAGCILVACAGNGAIGDANASGPGASPLTISIGATDVTDARAGFSGTGAALDFVAPGSSLETVHAADELSDSVDILNGCSAATPIAAGVISLLKARDPSLSQACVYELLRSTSDDQVGEPLEDIPGWDPYMGHGRLNAANALAAQAPCSSASLVGKQQVIDLGPGGSQDLLLTAHESFAGAVYVILGSITGTAPPFVIDGFSLPLIPDDYFLKSLTAPNTLVMSSLGTLDSGAQAQAAFGVPPGANPALAGISVYHAAVLLNPSASAVAGVSSASEVVLANKHVVFEDDFEAGQGAWWIWLNETSNRWHHAPAGECGTASASLSYDNGPGECGFSALTANGGYIISPSFTVTGTPPFELEFTSTFGIPSPNTVFRAQLRDANSDEIWLFNPEWPSTSAAPEQLVAPIPDSLAGELVQLEFYFWHPGGGSDGSGWRIDDVRVTASAP